MVCLARMVCGLMDLQEAVRNPEAVERLAFVLRQYAKPSSLEETVEVYSSEEDDDDDEWRICDLGVQRVPVDQLLSTRDAVGADGPGVFSNGPHAGRNLETLVSDLEAGRVSMSHPSLQLTVFSWPGHGLVAIGSRRLHCFKQYQDIVRSRTGQDVEVVAKVFKLPPAFARLGFGTSPVANG